MAACCHALLCHFARYTAAVNGSELPAEGTLFRDPPELPGSARRKVQVGPRL